MTTASAQTIITEVVRKHFSMNTNMSDEYTSAPEEIAQVVLQLLSAFSADTGPMAADEMRAALVGCGFPTDFAQEFIHDNDPTAIY